MNKKNNKGFSLVELIVVVAIMAVLVGVLAPAYLRYVEKSRAQKDVSAVAEVIEAAKIACAEETVADGVTTSTTITVADNALPTSNDSDLQTAIQEIIGTIDFTSKAWGGKTYTVKVTAAGTSGITIEEYNENNWSGGSQQGGAGASTEE